MDSIDNFTSLDRPITDGRDASQLPWILGMGLLFASRYWLCLIKSRFAIMMHWTCSPSDWFLDPLLKHAGWSIFAYVLPLLLLLIFTDCTAVIAKSQTCGVFFFFPILGV